MSVKIGHAHSDESNKANGGSSGDQTGKEVVIQEWYLRNNRGWSVVFRPKDIAIAEKIAKAMEQACTNDKIGYDQSQRLTLYTKAKELKWDLSKITEKCECDCSSLVAVCVNAAGVLVSKNMYTGNQKTLLEATGKFEVLTSSKYITRPDYLKRGDIILGHGHTAVVLSDGVLSASVEFIESKANDSAKSFLSSFSGVYKTTAALNIRQGASTRKKIMVTIPKGTSVTCYGYYTNTFGTDWLYVQFIYKDIKYTGFASAKYLVK